MSAVFEALAARTIPPPVDESHCVDRQSCRICLGHLRRTGLSVLMVTPSKLWVPDRRDIIWIDFSPQIGGEMTDKHPMMVLSPKAFNERTKLVIGLPQVPATVFEAACEELNGIISIGV